MISSEQESVILNAILAFQPGATQRQKDAVAALTALLATNTDARAALSTRARRRAKTGVGGRPARFYAVETQPGGVEYHKGAAAAHVGLVATLAKLDPTRKYAPTRQSMATRLSTAGHWTTTVETLDGVVAVTVRGVTEQELDRLLGTSGTTPA